MRKTLAQRMIRPVAALLCGIGLIGSTGCEKQTLTTIQDGVITASSSLLGAVMQSAIALALERANAG